MIYIGLVLIVISLLCIHSLYFHRHWKQVYTAMGHQQFFDFTQKLASKGIVYKTRSPLGSQQRRGAGIRSYDNVQYNIYIKKDDVHKL